MVMKYFESFKKIGLFLLKWKWVLSVVILLGIAGGLYAGYLLCDLPQIEKLDEGYRPDLITKVYSDKGEIIEEFANQKRIVISYQRIPDNFKNALIAVEDARFYDHWGVDIVGISRAMLRNFKKSGNVLKGQGASTLTQQLTKLLFLTPEKTVSRKIKEALLALQVELKYSKEQILEMYSNQVYFGKGVYGVESASRMYFGKSASDLTLEEAALLAGLPQRPNHYNPARYPERAVKRRNHVLRRMQVEGFISAKEFKEASQSPVVTAEIEGNTRSGSYFIEEVRKKMIKEFGAKELYSAGMKIHTTLNLEMQTWAENALRNGLGNIDKSYHKYRGVITNVADGDIENYDCPEWDSSVSAGSVLPGIITEVQNGKIKARIENYTGTMDIEGASWANIKNLKKHFKRGDVALFKIEEISDNNELSLSLEQVPEVQGAIVVIDCETGAVKALSGGYSFELSKFNRATQALRQTGSAFKPIVYAAALESGYTLADRLFDRPTLFVDYYSAEFYKPNNYSHKYYGITTLRRALEHSRNIVSVDLLNRIGYEPVMDLAKNLGITSNLRPYPSLALGASEVTLLDLTSAYSTFPNQGIRVKPRFINSIEHSDNSELATYNPQPLKVMAPETAFLSAWALTGVIQRGTGRSAAKLSQNIGGKTGTTDNYTDAWFCGFSSRYTVGVWVGYDKKKSLGRRMTGAGAALPIWKSFMEKIIEKYGAPPFQKPENIVMLPIDINTGLRATINSNCTEVIMEAFVRGTEPTQICDDNIHKLLKEDWNTQLELLNSEYKNFDAQSIPTQNFSSLGIHRRLINKLTEKQESKKVRKNVKESLSTLNREGNIKVTILKKR